jgi:phenylacetate-CoA ligase
VSAALDHDGARDAESLAPMTAVQGRKLVARLDALRETSEFYRERVPAAPTSGDRGAFEWLAATPLLSRGELEAEQAAHPPFGRGGPAEPALLARTGVGFSFTGRRLNVAVGHADVQRQGRLFRRALEIAGLGVGDRVYLADDPRYNAVGISALRAVCDVAATVVYVAAERTLRTARFVTRVLPPHAYVLTPTYALYLAEVLAQEGRKDLPVKALIAWGEPGFSMPGWRERTLAAWERVTAARPVLVDVYAMSEVGIVAVGCAGGHGLHCLGDAVLVEVVDPASGRAVASGERGEIVVTHLEPHGFPLVRYRTGDTAIRLERCACGWAQPALAGVERAAEAVRVRGRSLAASDIEDVVAGMASGGLPFRIVEDGGDILSIQVSEADAAEPRQLERALADALGVPVSVERRAAGEITAFRHRRLRVIGPGTAGLHDEVCQDDAQLE